MRGKLLVIAFAVLAVVAGALTFEPSATNASTGAKPSATPRTRIRAAPRRRVTPIAQTGGSTAADPTVLNGIKRKPPKHQKKPTMVFQGLNVNPVVKRKQGTMTNQYGGTPADGTGIKRKPPKHPKRHH